MGFIMTSEIFVPSLEFFPLEKVDWPSSSELIRFRESSRPREILSEKVIIKSLGRRNVAIIADPVAAQKVLISKSESFPKALVQQKLGKSAFGPGISGTLGEQNKRQRKALQTLVSSKQVRSVSSISEEIANDAVTRWLALGRIDLYREMSELALQITWCSMFGAGQYHGRDNIVTEVINELHACPKSDFVSSADVVRKLVKHFESTERWKSVINTNPFSKISCPFGWQSNNHLSQEELRANALVFAASGHVTTGISMAWTSWLLGQDQALQSEVLKDSYLDDNKHSMLRDVINETLRLFPPGPEVMRDSSEAIQIDDTHVPAGSMLIISIYALHRHKLLWNSPDQFIPSRFQTDLPVPGSFLPFSGGTYGCSGPGLAMAEMISVIFACLKKIRFRVDKADAAMVKLEPGICLYPGSKLIATIEKRLD